MSRVVKEDLSQKKMIELHSKKKAYSAQDDHCLQNIDLSLKNLERDFGKTSSEIAEIFCLVSGRIPKVREYLQFEK